MGPGPSPVHPRVLAALGLPTVGHLDPDFLRIMDEVQALLRAVFGTQNRLTFPVSGTGSAGMEACMVNVLEPGDRVVIVQNGVFGGRMVDIARRLGCAVETVSAPFGQAVSAEALGEALAGQPTKLVGCVHAETSTGVAQDVAAFAREAQQVGALCMADCVTSLGGMPVEVDAWGVDLAYAGTQKCLSCPPGLAPVTFSERALAVLESRTTPVVSWYLDVSMLVKYWGGERVYHHTAPVNMIYALRESLILLMQEGVEASHERHLRMHRALVAGLEAMGLEMVVAPELRLPQLNTVWVPAGVDDARLRRRLLTEYGLEVGGGLGAFAGKVLRIGLMGHGARPQNVLACLSALGAVLAAEGAQVHMQRGLEAAHSLLAPAALG